MGQKVEQLSLNWLAVGLILLMCAIVLQVICSALDINPIVTFTKNWPLVGTAIALNSLLDLQWHLLVITGLLPVGLVWSMDRHVRVDFLYQRLAGKTQSRVNLIGNLLFASPFFALVLSAAWGFMQRAWSSDEGSTNGGLNDLWLIKAVLPVGLGLLALAIFIETLRLVRAAR